MESNTRYATVEIPMRTLTLVAEAGAWIVPTHRVVGRSGNIGGFAGGLQFKRTLLEIEGNRWIAQSQRSDLRYLTLERTPMAAHVA